MESGISNAPSFLFLPSFHYLSEGGVPIRLVKIHRKGRLRGGRETVGRPARHLLSSQITLEPLNATLTLVSNGNFFAVTLQLLAAISVLHSNKFLATDH